MQKGTDTKTIKLKGFQKPATSKKLISEQSKKDIISKHVYSEIEVIKRVRNPVRTDQQDLESRKRYFAFMKEKENKIKSPIKMWMDFEKQEKKNGTWIDRFIEVTD